MIQKNQKATIHLLCFSKLILISSNTRKKRRVCLFVYLVINELRPETSQGSMVRIRGQDGITFPGLIHIFNNHKGLSDGLLIVKKHRDLLVNWVVFQQKIAFVGQRFMNEFIFHPLQFQSNLCPRHKWASYDSKKLHFLICSHGNTCLARNFKICV